MTSYLEGRRRVGAWLVILSDDSTEIRCECIEPDVKDVRVFARNRNAPANRSARDAQVAEAAFDEAENFVAASFGLDEFGILGIVLAETLSEFGEFEIEILFGNCMCGPAAIRTIFAGLYVYVRIVEDAVLPSVVPRIDIAIFAAALKQPLHGSVVLHISGANKSIALDAEFVPKGAPLRGHFGDEFGFGYAGFFGGALDVDAVLVGTGGHDHVVAAHALVAADGIAPAGRVGVTV